MMQYIFNNLLYRYLFSLVFTNKYKEKDAINNYLFSFIKLLLTKIKTTIKIIS